MGTRRARSRGRRLGLPVVLGVIVSVCCPAAIVVALGAQRDAPGPVAAGTLAAEPAQAATAHPAAIAYGRMKSERSPGADRMAIAGLERQDAVLVRGLSRTGLTSWVSDPAWSFDGRSLALLAEDRVRTHGPNATKRGRLRLRPIVYDTRTHAARALTWVLGANGLDDSRNLLAWSPSGRELLVRSPKGLRLVDIATGQARTLVAGDAAGASFSPDGTRIVFESAESLWVYRPADRDLRKIVSDGAQPSWSPDGAKIAFVSTRDRHGAFATEGGELPTGEIYTADATGAHQRRVTRTTADEARPIWTSDGDAIIFERLDPTGRRNPLVAVRPDGTCPTSVSQPRGPRYDPNAGFAWRPGGATSALHMRCAAA